WGRDDAGRVPAAPGPAPLDSQARQPALFAAASRGGCHCRWGPDPWSWDAAGRPVRSGLGSARPAEACSSRLSSARPGGQSVVGKSQAYLLEQAETQTGQEQAEQALHLCIALFWYWYLRGYVREGRAFLERALTARKGGDLQGKSGPLPGTGRRAGDGKGSLF